VSVLGANDASSLIWWDWVGRNAERARAEMLKVLGDFPAEMKRTLESR